MKGREKDHPGGERTENCGDQTVGAGEANPLSKEKGERIKRKEETRSNLKEVHDQAHVAVIGGLKSWRGERGWTDGAEKGKESGRDETKDLECETSQKGVKSGIKHEIEGEILWDVKNAPHPKESKDVWHRDQTKEPGCKETVDPEPEKTLSQS